MSNKSELCRVCLNSQQDVCVPLSEKYQNVVLYEFINNITNLNIRLSDGFPDQICNCCYSLLKSSIDFKQKCEASDVILRSNAVKVEKATVKIFKVEREYNDEYIDYNYNGPLTSESEQDVKAEKKYKPSLVSQETPKEETEHKVVTKIEIRGVDQKLICHDCNGTFRSKCKLKVHWKKAHLLDSLVCPFCKRTFRSYKAFHAHKTKKTKSCQIATHKNVNMEGVGRARIYCCKECNYRSKRAKDISAHVVIHTGDRPFQCNICLKTYTQQSSLQGHQEAAHQMFIVEMTCHVCGKFVKGRRKVSRHLRSHTRVECPVCHKTISKLTYPQHMKRHSGSKSYSCEKCAYRFYTMAELCNHKRVKHGNKKFKCDLCDFTSNAKQTIKNHKPKHSNINIPCNVCGKFFYSDEKLALHQVMHYSERKFGCPQCDLRFHKRDSLRRHLKSKHLVAAQKKTTVVIKTEALPQALEVTE